MQNTIKNQYRIRFSSLGCPKNLVDSEVMLGHLTKAGYKIYPDNNLSYDNIVNCDIFIINTCCFIKEAEQESRNTIKEVIKLRRSWRNKKLTGKNGYKIIVSGCLAQRYHEKLNQEFKGEIDGIIGLTERNKIVNLCDDLLNNNGLEKKTNYLKDYWDSPTKECKLDTQRLRITPSHYAYLKIAEGCNNHCSYCIIPDTHGPYRSKPLDAIIDETMSLVSQGVKEINLIAQDTTSYGKDFKTPVSLSKLLKKLAEVKHLKWIRLLYTHPAHFSNELINTIRDLDKVVKYIDLPIQHISDNILSLMRRHITSDEIKQLIYTIRKQIPDVFLRTSVIVGFPGETENDFRKLLEFMEEIEFERLGAFQYSREKNTSASKLNNHIPIKIKQERLNSVMALQQKIAFKKNNSLINKSLTTIIDYPHKDIVYSQQNKNGVYIGRTYGDAPEVDGNIIVKTNTNRRISAGDVIKVKVIGTENYDLIGEL
ncbi:MAG: 30S ribosomal protein S12 methylthiotransferase RimO [Planctomycetota bacterium]